MFCSSFRSFLQNFSKESSALLFRLCVEEIAFDVFGNY